MEVSKRLNKIEFQVKKPVIQKMPPVLFQILTFHLMETFFYIQKNVF